MPYQTKLIGESDAYLAVLEQTSHLTSLNRPVLIVGERGTGKELIAERLHFLSSRWDKPLIKMNCAAVNDALLESELFGHESGAFTGANKRHIGRFERAEGGTLFLDELATMSLKTQEKLLRFIEYKEFERLGGNATLKADVRLVAATNLHLPELAANGQFRNDLLDRLAFDVITLPPLRARREDILLLAEHFAVNMCKELGLPYFVGFNNHAKTTLLQCAWPGNIRQLKNAVERSVYRQQETHQAISEIQLDPFDSPYRLHHSQNKFNQNTQSNSYFTEGESDPNDSHQTEGPKTEKTKGNEPIDWPIDFKLFSANYEKDLLQQALQHARFNQREAAKLLRLTYHQLRSLIRKYGL